MSQFFFKRGDTLFLTFTYTDSVTKLPISLVGSSAKLDIRNKNTKTVVVQTSTTTTGLTISSNVVTLNVTPSPVLPIGLYETDLEVTYPDGRKESTDTITIEIVEDITQ